MAVRKPRGAADTLLYGGGGTPNPNADPDMLPNILLGVTNSMRAPAQAAQAAQVPTDMPKPAQRGSGIGHQAIGPGNMARGGGPASPGENKFLTALFSAIKAGKARRA